MDQDIPTQTLIQPRRRQMVLRRKFLSSKSNVHLRIRGEDHPIAVKELDSSVQVVEMKATREETKSLRSALDEAESALESAIRQMQRNVSHLRDARLEVETARDIASTSNQMASEQKTLSFADLIGPIG